MYEDFIYSFDLQSKRVPPNAHGSGGHRRGESLLQQPNGGANDAGHAPDPRDVLLEHEEPDNSPPPPTLSRRAKSYSNFYGIATAHFSKDRTKRKPVKRKPAHGRSWEALALAVAATASQPNLSPRPEELSLAGGLLRNEELLEASQQEYLLYLEQLAMTERHLDGLIADTDTALALLESLSRSFGAVEEQTTSFQAQCNDILSEQKRLQNLAHHVGTELHYYAYLDNVTRRLNASGASRLADDETLREILDNLDACIGFMTKNPTYRDAESYLARYQSLLTKALHLLEVAFTKRLEKVSAEISKQIASTQSESAQHALAYGRFEEMMLESYSLVPNIQRVVTAAYDEFGLAKPRLSWNIYANTANNLFHSYWGIRDRDLKPITHHDLEAFKREVKETSVETAARSFIKQCFERSFNEASLFAKIFSVDPQHSTKSNSAYVALRSPSRSLVCGTNIMPVATGLQATLQGSDLQVVCNVIGWILNEYLVLDFGDDESDIMIHYFRGLAARLLAEHLWAFADAAFEAEIAKSISRAAVPPEALKIGPVSNGVASSNALPPVRRALELLVMFDQSMPKERCQRSSPVVFKIVKESIAALQRAEARIKSAKNGTDADLFMIKNLLILKNELVALEIGDVRSQAVLGSMQHFTQIWDTISPGLQNLMGLLSSFSSYIPGTSLLPWSRGGNPPSPALGGGGSSSASAGANGAGTGAGYGAGADKGDSEDASEELDELLRRSIYAFTQRWAVVLNEVRAAAAAKGRPHQHSSTVATGGVALSKRERELEEMLDRAFSNQPEVVAKLKEAIQVSAQQQQKQGASEKKWAGRITRA